MPFLFAENAPEENTEVNIEELRERVLGEAPLELMSFTLGDAEVSLFLTGSWYGFLQGNLGFSNSPLGFAFASPDTPLLFKQEVDLSLSLWIDDRWFVEANFEDDSALNTYRAGYQGLSGDFLQYAGIGNTGLDFPSFAYLDLGGDTPSSFGFYSRFGTEDLSVHALLRYDAAAREERTFIGGRERTYADIGIQNTIRGISFVLPDTNIDSEITVYIEDEKGGIRDDSGRRWRLALPGEYAASGTQGLLELSIRPPGMIAVVYEKNGQTPWVNSLGDFLTDVQNWFDPGKSKINIDNYPLCADEINLEGRSALVIYRIGTFSPFERQSRYDSPSSSSQSADLVRVSTGNRVTGFEIVMIDNTALELTAGTLPAIFNQRRIYELLRTDRTKDIRDPRSRWPLADEYPEIYLPPKSVFTGDLTLRFTNLNSASGYYIGTDVTAGSVQVWRSGIEDSGFSYDQSMGEVIIAGPVGQNELIRITFLKKGKGTRTGSIAAGAGAVYQKASSPFYAQSAVGILWNLSDESYTQEDESNAGTAGISAKAGLDYDFLKAHAAAGFNFVQTDTSGLYRAAGMEGNETFISMPVESSFISNQPVSHNDLVAANRADLIYRNYYNSGILGSSLMTIEWNAPLVSGINRPYPVKDSRLNTQITVAEFELDSFYEWTGFQVPLVNYSELFSYAQEIEIPFSFYNITDAEKNNLKLIIQIGSLSGRDFSFAENPDLVWEKTLFDDQSAFYLQDGNYTIARFKLNNEDRLKLGDAAFLRVIAVNEGGGSISGRVLLAPPIVRGASFRAVTLQNGNVTGNSDNISAVESLETGGNKFEAAYPSLVKRFHTNLNTQRVLKVQWDNMEQGVSAGIDGRAARLPLADYRELSFFIKINDDIFNNDETITFTAGSGPNALKNYQLEASLPLSAFKNKTGQWSKVTIRYNGGQKIIFLDGAAIAGSAVDYKPAAVLSDNSVNKSTYIAIFFSPSDSSQTLNNGTVYIDEIIMEDAVTINRINAGASIEYSRPGTLILAGSLPVLADLHVSTAVETETLVENNSDDESQITGSIVNRSEIGVSVMDTKITGNLSFTSADDMFLWNAGHSLSRKFGPFSAGENFYASVRENNARHNVNLSLLTDFFASFNADADYDYDKLIQRWNLGTGYRPKNIFIPSVTINAEAAWQSGYQFNDNKNYGELWIESFEPLVPDSGSGADNRRMNAQIIITQRTKPIGAVLGFEGSSNFTGISNTTGSENTAWLEIPVTLEKTGFSIKAGRGFKRHLYYSGADALNDAGKFLESVNDSFPFWEVFPFYSLFAAKMNDAMDISLLNSPSYDDIFYSSFIDHFSTRISLPSIYNLTAFFIPSRLSFRMERVLEQKMDTRTDTLNLNAGLSFSALNMLGAMGYAPVFKFYQSDEYHHSIDAAVSIPAAEDVSWRLQSVLSAGFRGFSGGVLSFVNTLSLRSQNYWTESLGAYWETPLKRSFLGVFYDLIASNAEKQSSWLYSASIFNSAYEQLRRESLEMVFDNSTDYLRWTVTAGHEEIIRILGKLNFSAFIKLRFNNDHYRDIFVFDAQIGTALRIIF